MEANNLKVYPESPKTDRPALSNKNIAVIFNFKLNLQI